MTQVRWVNFPRPSSIHFTGCGVWNGHAPDLGTTDTGVGLTTALQLDLEPQLIIGPRNSVTRYESVNNAGKADSSLLYARLRWLAYSPVPSSLSLGAAHWELLMAPASVHVIIRVCL